MKPSHPRIPKAQPNIVPPSIPSPRKESLEAENTRLKAEVDALKLGSLLTAVDVLQFINLKAECERLRNLAIKFDGYLDLVRHENKRLRKAGDAMKSAYYNSQFAGMVPPEENPDTEEVMVRVDNAYKAVEEAMANWNAAKEGEPNK